LKNRKLRLVANVSGFDTLIAEVKIQNFADEIDVKEWTDLVCPSCGTKPFWKGGYVCPNDSQAFNHWSKLKRVIKGTATALSIPRLLKEKEEAVAKLSYLTTDEFSHNYVDATRKDEGEKGIILTDSASARNLFKLLVAVEQLKYVIIAKWNDTTEEVVGLLTVSASGRILIREIIPSNLVQVRETLFIDRKSITKQEVEEAKAFVEHFIPKATDETFAVADYRAQWKEGHVTEGAAPEPQKVADIKEIMKQLVQVPAPKKKPKAK
jgi:hypothetical protein